MPSKSADAFRTISEVADWLNTPAHVLRFWESKFSQVKPVKRAGGRRYYRPADMTLIGGIKKLLHDDGMTIKGVQKILREQGIKHVAAMSPPLDEDLSKIIEPPVTVDATLASPMPPPEPTTGQVLEFAERGSDDAPAVETAQPVDETPEQAVETTKQTAPSGRQDATIADLFDDTDDEDQDNFFAPSGPPATAEQTDDLPLEDLVAEPEAQLVAEEDASSTEEPVESDPIDHEPKAVEPEPETAQTDASSAASAPLESEFSEPDQPVAPESESEPATVNAAADDLPDFVQKPLSERLAEEDTAPESESAAEALPAGEAHTSEAPPDEPEVLAEADLEADLETDFEPTSEATEQADSGPVLPVLPPLRRQRNQSPSLTSLNVTVMTSSQRSPPNPKSHLPTPFRPIPRRMVQSRQISSRRPTPRITTFTPIPAF
ncbi:MerR family transcriptional regulator [Phaeobacter sp. J2-8]|uniref:MerR family transcriptional regulator n=1 Tax=Phaeobacter sp. J2-8 TaxID=2931394 RepID=UPI001FD524F3|nr:MerR family transcriptional regulator [Phaeobacter sp. J2-8]MCJ7871990.1 MerR family transcriptional regulator [Phaeobacter sp. J2-8]